MHYKNESNIDYFDFLSSQNMPNRLQKGGGNQKEFRNIIQLLNFDYFSILWYTVIKKLDMQCYSRYECYTTYCR